MLSAARLFGALRLDSLAVPGTIHLAPRVVCPEPWPDLTFFAEHLNRLCEQQIAEFFGRLPKDFPADPRGNP
jgi:hypothetical protein